MKRFLPLLLTLASFGVMGQQANVTLDVKPSDGQKQVKQEQATIALAKAAYPNWYARAKVLGWTDQRFLDQSKFVAKWQQLQYFSSPLGTNAPTASTVTVTVPEGNYFNNEICELGRGTYRGAGTFEYHTGNYTTTISVWHEKWTNGGPRDLFRTSNFGSEGDAGYAESFRFEGFRLDGRAAIAILPDPAYTSTGFVGWDNGETSNVEYIYAHAFNTNGIEFVRGTPARGDLLTVFNNCRAGIMLTGTAGNTFAFIEVSGDDNDVLIEQQPGYGREAGGQMAVLMAKSEAGVTPISRNPHRKQRLFVFRGQFGGFVGVCRGSNKDVRVENLIEVDCRLKNGTPQVSNLMIGSINGFNYGNAVRDLSGGWSAKSPGDFNCYELHYTSKDGGKLWNPFFQFEGAPNAGGGTVPPVIPPSTTGKDTRTFDATADPKVTTNNYKVPAPANLGTINETRLTNVKVQSLAIAYINSNLFIGNDGYLWLSNGFKRAKDSAGNDIKVVVGQALNVSVPMAGTTLTHCVGGAGATAILTGKIELY